MTFTPNPPTIPGAYWWKYGRNSNPELVELVRHHGGICELDSLTAVENLYGLWSPRLVSVEEVENAYVEGFHDGKQTNSHHDWEHSRAREVVEGNRL